MIESLERKFLKRIFRTQGNSSAFIVWAIKAFSSALIFVENEDEYEDDISWV